MAHRNEERTPLRLTALVWGMDGNGQVFMEQVQTLDISPMGARIKGLTHSVAIGAILGIQNGDNQGRFQVVWIGEPGSDREGQIGMRCVQLGRSIKKAILYVDDHEHELDRRRSIMEAFGYGVHTAQSAAKATEVLTGFHLQAVLLDDPIADCSTVDFIEQVRATQPQAKIVLTSAFPAKVSERALKLADGFVHKGDNPNKLMSLIEQLIGPGSGLKWPLTRCIQRYMVVVNATIRVMRSGVNTTLQAKSTDLGEGGIGVQIDEGELIPGEIISVEFALPTTKQPVRIYATVRHRKLNQYGIEFINVAPEQRQAIRDLCEVLVPISAPH